MNPFFYSFRQLLAKIPKIKKEIQIKSIFHIFPFEGIVDSLQNWGNGLQMSSRNPLWVLLTSSNWGLALMQSLSTGHVEKENYTTSWIEKLGLLDFYTFGDLLYQSLEQMIKHLLT